MSAGTDKLRDDVARALFIDACAAAYDVLPCGLNCGCVQDTERALTAINIPLATLAGLRDGSLVAVPREATELRYERAEMDVDGRVDSPSTDLRALGDCRLVWVNEGDLYRPAALAAFIAAAPRQQEAGDE
jgi:hypothetical protein